MTLTFIDVKKKFTAIFDDSICFGVIEIIKTDKIHKTAYVGWSISNSEEKPIAGFINDYFLGKDDFTNEEVFNLVKNQIHKYRIGRKKVFSNVEFEK